MIISVDFLLLPLNVAILCDLGHDIGVNACNLVLIPD